jgi:Rrf2 family nitric oxide-sensitive transcriptional repressor
MRLNVQTDYALRLLMHLAVNTGRLVTIKEASDRFGISKTHRMTLASGWTPAGCVEALRGRSGGLRLARPAAEIRVGEVVRRMENDFDVVECFRAGRNECLITPACHLKGVLHRAVEAFLSELDSCTLEDLVKTNQPLRLLLA